MKRLFVWGTVLSGVAAAYLMYKRGAPLATIAKNAITNPLGTFASELKNAL